MTSLREAPRVYLPRVRRLGLKNCVWNRGKRDKGLHPDLRMYRDFKIQVYYAPYDPDRPRARFKNIRVYFIGLTPGFQQAEMAFKNHFEPHPEGHNVVSYRGSMRKNLVRLLDALDLHRALGISTSADLFTDRRDLAEATSLLRFPVFKSEPPFENYGGSSPEPDRHPFMMKMIEEIFVPELAKLNARALIVPFGKAAEKQVRRAAPSLGGAVENRCLFGFPHPSGANNGRVFEYLKSGLRDHRAVIQNLF